MRMIILIKINKITKNVKYEGSKLKGLKLRTKIDKIKNDINSIEEYETQKREDYKNSLGINSILKPRNSQRDNLRKISFGNVQFSY